MQFLKFIFVIILDFVFSWGTSYVVWTKWIDKINEESSCGTGVMAEAFLARIVTIVIFVVLLSVYGFLFYWILFTVI